MSDTPITSILAVDIGSVHTRALLFDIVDGEYSLVARGQARTTIGYPIDDVHVGVGRILKDISDATGRRFYNDARQIIIPEQSDRSGVDYFVTTASAGRPVRVIMVGLVPNISIETALRATTSSYVEPVAEIHLDDNLTEEERINHIILSRPDLIFIAGGTDGGTQNALLDLINLLQLTLMLIPEISRPTVLYAGNAKLANTAKEMLGELTKVLIAPNVRPTEDEEELEPAQILLGQAYDEHKERRSVSFREIASMSSSGILPTAQGYATLTDYLSKLYRLNVLTIDIGSATTVFSMSVNKKTNTNIRTDIGMGHSANTLLNIIGEDAIAEWIPFYLQPGELLNYTLNKVLRPATIPINLREMYIEHAMLRASIRYMINNARKNWDNLPTYGDMPPIGLIISGGSSLTGTGHPALDMLLLIDAIQPKDITHVKADPYGVIPALGALALREPRAVVQLLDGHTLRHLGTVISVTGNPNYESWAIQLDIKTDDGEEFEHEIMGGDIWHLPLPQHVSLEVTIKLARGLTINNKRKLQIRLEGGEAGVLFDARGRDLSMGKTPAERAENMPRWFAAVTEQEDPDGIPEEWLVKPEIEAVETPQQPAKKRRRNQDSEMQDTVNDRIQKITGELPDLEDLTDGDSPDDADIDSLFEDDDYESLRK